MELSVCIITLNEEKRLAKTLASLPAGAQIIVLDSGSQDRTKEIARTFGAEVHERAFDDYAQQRNAALSLASKDWVMMIDADEILSPRLCEEIQCAITKPWADAYRIKRQLVFMNRTLRFGRSCDQPLRLFKRKETYYEEPIHEKPIVQGRVSTLKGPLYHESYDDLTDYFTRFNLYTTKIAENHLKRNDPLNPFYALRLYYEFIARYLIRLGFLDGYPGYVWALLSSFYAYVKYLKLAELKAKKG